MINTRLSLAGKFIILTSSLILITSSIIAFFIIQNEIKLINKELVDHGKSVAAMFAQNSEYGIYAEDKKTLQQLVESISKNPEIVYIALIKDKNRVLINKVNNPLIEMPTRLRQKTITQTDQILHEEFFNNKDGSYYIDVMAPVLSYTQKDTAETLLYSVDGRAATKVIGYVQLGLSKERLSNQIKKMLIATILFTSLLVLLGIAVTIYMTKRITFPLKALSNALHYISDGNFESYLDIKSNDEISDLSKSFNDMLTNLKAYRTHVQKNTSELFDANVQMQAEITERKRAEKELIAAKAQLEKLLISIKTEKEFSDAIFNHTASGIIVLTKGGHVLKINYMGTKILQLEMHEIIGKKITSLYPETKAMLLLEAKTGMEINLKLKDGTEIPIEFTNSLLLESSYGDEKIVVLFRNIAEIKKLQRELKKKEYFEAMVKIIAGVAHEIRNPLFGISSIGQIIEREIDVPQHKALIQTMIKEAERIKRIIEELVLYTKPLNLDIKEFDIGILVEELNHYLKSMGADIKFSAIIPPLLMLKADRDKILQVFLNLLNNAIDAASNIITISAQTSDGTIKITVVDNGNGIKKEDIDRIFDPFFTTKRGGTGLGLSICKKIIEDHGGIIEVQSSGGNGTVVILTFKEWQ